MKRLVRKSEYINHFMWHGDVVYVFKNPSSSEAKDIINSNQNEDVRMILDYNGELYAWNGEVLHGVAMLKINLPDAIRIECGKYDMDIFINGIDFNEFKIIFKKAYPYIKYFNINDNTPLKIYGTENQSQQLSEIKTVGEIFTTNIV